MWNRKSMIAALVLVAVGLTVTVTTGVIGQQPGKREKNSSAEEKNAPAAGGTSATDSSAGTGNIAPAFDAPIAEEGAAGSSSSGFEEGDSKQWPTGGGSASEARSYITIRRPASIRQSDDSMQQPNPGIGMPGMGGNEMTSDNIPTEDEHLETLVSGALAEYAGSEDQVARTRQQEEIAKALDRIFDIRQERRMQELATLERRVQKLRETLETRGRLKSDILKNRLDYLMREADGLGWGDGIPAPKRSLPTGFGPAGSSGSGAYYLPASGGVNEPARGIGPAVSSGSGASTGNSGSGASTGSSGSGVSSGSGASTGSSGSGVSSGSDASTESGSGGVGIGSGSSSAGSGNEPTTE